MADVYEITNPSDAYTIVGEREPVCAAVLLLGEGAYGVHDENDAVVLPVLMFARAGAAEEWWKETFGRTMGESLEACRAQLADALETVMIGSRAERSRMERVLASITSPEDRGRARDAWHDQRRSSMNDIGTRAARLAAQLRAKEAARAG